MKTLNKLFATGAMVFLLMLMAPHKSMAQDNGYVSDQEFYDELQQYGTWVQDDQYGDVWVPDVDGDFRPYATNGYWVQTDYGTTWVSDYPWGWATFHYGRWRYDDYYGWEWIPGHEWAPAWVSWRQGGGYYGWAPMGPGISLTLSLGGIGLNINNNYWVYAPQRYITSRYISRYYAPRTQINIIIRKTTYIHNTYVYNKRTYITGPRPAEIRRVTHRNVNVYKINDAPRPGGAHIGVNVINIYRPNVKKAPDARPVRVVSASAYKNEHPNEGIGKKGVVGYNHGNAGKLASAARTDNPDGKIVKVNPRKDKNVPNRPAVNNNPAIPIGGHKTTEPKTNPGSQPVEPKGNRGNHKNTPAVQPQQGGDQQAQPAGNKAAEPQGNEPVQGRGHHKTVPAAPQPQQGTDQPQPRVDQQHAQPQGNPPAQPGQVNQPARRQHKQAPAVILPEQNNTDQAKKEEQQQQQARDLALQQKQQALELQRQQRQQEQQQKQQEQQAARQQAAELQKQQRQQEQQQKQQDQQAVRQQAAQQQKQQQLEQQAARQQAAQQQKQQQQQAQQAARQQAQQERQQAAQQKKQQEELQKQQQQNPPRN